MTLIRCRLLSHVAQTITVLITSRKTNSVNHQNILEGKRLPVYGNGTNVRDWLYVEDHCKAIDLVVRQGKNGEIYNVGGHNEKQNIEIVKLTIATIRRLMEEEPAYRKVLKKKNWMKMVKSASTG